MFRRKSRAQSAAPGTLRKSAAAAAMSRSTSLPTRLWRPKKGIMKFVSADESMHKVYGQNTQPGTDSEDDSSKGNIQFKAVEIREYARTVGDNPSCSSGPPIS